MVTGQNGGMDTVRSEPASEAVLSRDLPWRRPGLWSQLASALRDLRNSGVGPLLTEDALRLELAKLLVDGGVPAAALAVEQPHPTRPRARIDLIATEPTPGVVIELKWPREPSRLNAAWPDALGGVLADLHRLAEHPGDADRVFVLSEAAPFTRYLAGVRDRVGIHLDVDDLVLLPETLTGLSATTRRSLPAPLLAPLCGRRLHAELIDADLRLAVFMLDELRSGVVPPKVSTAVEG